MRSCFAGEIVTARWLRREPGDWGVVVTDRTDITGAGRENVEWDAIGIGACWWGREGRRI